MQYFHEENYVSTHNSKRALKRKERLAKTEAVLEEYALNRNLEDALENKNNQILNEEFYNTVKSYRKNSKKDFTEAHRENSVLNEKIDELCRDLFFFTVYESLLVDEDVKARNFNYIKEEAYKFFDLFNGKNLIKIEEGSGFGDIIDTAVSILVENHEETDCYDIKKTIQKTILSESMNVFFAVESIKLKTADCLRQEKKGSILKEQLAADDKYIDPNKSLFRVLFESNIQDVIDQSNNKNPDSLQDISMVETILDYTLLETANTLKMVEFRNLRKVLK